MVKGIFFSFSSFMAIWGAICRSGAERGLRDGQLVAATVPEGEGPKGTLAHGPLLLGP
jgi:hypothetical protein